jgi:Na+/H+-dicarboxylate symporter
MSGGEKRGLALHWKILIALALALVVGLVLHRWPRALGFDAVATFKFLGDLFLRLLQMLVAPLILTSIVTAIARLGADRAFGRLGLRTMAFYLTTTALAVLVGLVCVNVIGPGRVPPEVSQQMIAGLGQQKGAIAEKIAAQTDAGATSVLAGVLQRMIPSNVFAAFASNQEMLAIIFFGIVFGYFVSKLEPARREPFLGWWDSAYEVMLRMTDWVIGFAPYGVFGLVVATVATTGLGALGAVLTFFFTVLAGLAIHFFLVLPGILLLFGRSPLAHYRTMLPAFLTSFSTASSSATVPVTMECLQKDGYVSRKVTSFVIPLGATVNMDGTALYECVAAMFIAQIYGIEITFGKQLIVVLLALVTSIGVAGVPAASLVAIVIILTAIGLPMEAIGLILAVDRILDMCRTTVNVTSDSCAAAVVGRGEAE